MIDLSEVSGSDKRKRYLVGVPFVLLVILIAPLIAVLAPVVLVACLIARVDPLNAYRVLWRVLTALRGTHLEVTERDRSVLVHIS
jgi:hypothetical protein